jgi:hypothetical protein
VYFDMTATRTVIVFLVDSSCSRVFACLVMNQTSRYAGSTRLSLIGSCSVWCHSLSSSCDSCDPRKEAQITATFGVHWHSCSLDHFRRVNQKLQLELLEPVVTKLSPPGPGTPSAMCIAPHFSLNVTPYLPY